MTPLRRRCTEHATPLALDLVQTLGRLALQSNAGIELVAAAVPVSADEQDQISEAGDPTPRSKTARSLVVMGGIGAVLRFALDKGQPTAEL